MSRDEHFRSALIQYSIHTHQTIEKNTNYQKGGRQNYDAAHSSPPGDLTLIFSETVHVGASIFLIGYILAAHEWTWAQGCYNCECNKMWNVFWTTILVKWSSAVCGISVQLHIPIEISVCCWLWRKRMHNPPRSALVLRSRPIVTFVALRSLLEKTLMSFRKINCAVANVHVQ